MISVEQQFAEKLHAYTLPRQRPNTRVKDLVDMVLLIKMRPIELSTFEKALQLIFKVRGTHQIPQQLDPPQQNWDEPYKELANECALTLSLNDAYEEILDIYSQLFTSNKLI